MHPLLERLRSDLETAMAFPDGSDITPEGKWSSARLLEHLFLTYKHTNLGLARCQAGASPVATQPTWKHRVGVFVVIDLGHMPGGIKAPDRVVPQGMPPEEVRALICPELGRMDSALTDCAGRFGASTKIMDHPILGPLSVEQWRKLHWVHGRHHVRQILERRKG